MQQFKQGEMETKVLKSVESAIQKHTSDYKCFIAKRKSINTSQYEAWVAVIVDIELSLSVLKELALLTPLIKFSSSQVTADDERGVDILEFSFLCEIFDESAADLEEDEFKDSRSDYFNAELFLES